MSVRSIAFRTGRDRAAAVADVTAHLRRGGLIVYPTETVYGIGCALLPGPLAALAEAKRPAGHRPFLLLVPGDRVPASLRWTDGAARLAAAFWPGPLTLALQATPGAFPAEVVAADGTVAIRHSPHEGVSAIVEALGAPITSTSANVPGESPARDAAAGADAARRLGLREVLVLDGGTLPVAASSTLVRADDDGVRILRAGAIGETELMSALGEA